MSYSTKNRKTSFNQHIKYFNFRSKIQLEWTKLYLLSDVVHELRGDRVSAPLLEDSVVVDGGDARHRLQVRDRRLEGGAAQRRKRFGCLQMRMKRY